MSFCSENRGNEKSVEETVRPIPFFVIVILWSLGLYFAASAIVSVSCKPIPEWSLFSSGDYVGAIFSSVISLTLAVVFTVIFIMFKGVRYRIFPDRIEFQQGKHPRLGPVQILSFDELESIYWNIQSVGDESPPDSTFIEFQFSSRNFQLHKAFNLVDSTAEMCRTIERDAIAPKIIHRIEEGETVEFLRPDKYPSYEIRIDNDGIKDWDQHRISWNEIRSIKFSKGEESRYSNFLAQSRIRIEDISGTVIEFDMPRQNPHALWNVIKTMSASAKLDVVDFPKEESEASPPN